MHCSEVRSHRLPGDVLFSDRLRGWKLGLSALLLVVLIVGFGLQADAAPFGWRRLTADPAAHDGEPLIFSLYAVTAIEGPNRYRISKVIRDIPIAGPTDTLSEGDVVSVAATFRAVDAIAVEASRQRHELRPYKQVLGAVGLLWALWMVPRCFAWRGGRVVERG
ncbi:MAG: hypothetical protein AAFV53_43600 [Myxococcota bacterium]